MPLNEYRTTVCCSQCGARTIAPTVTDFITRQPRESRRLRECPVCKGDQQQLQEEGMAVGGDELQEEGMTEGGDDEQQQMQGEGMTEGGDDEQQLLQGEGMA